MCSSIKIFFQQLMKIATNETENTVHINNFTVCIPQPLAKNLKCSGNHNININTMQTITFVLVYFLAYLALYVTLVFLFVVYCTLIYRCHTCLYTF